MKRSFNLIELIAVLAVFAIIISLVFPSALDLLASTSLSSVRSLQTEIQAATDMYVFETGGNFPATRVPREFIPEVIDFSRLHPKFLNRVPPPNLFYFVDSQGKVWVSHIDAPSDIRIEGNYLRWGSVPEVQYYRVYEVREAPVASLASPLFLIADNVKSNSLRVYSSKNHVVVAVSRRGVSTPPAGKGYLGHRIPEIDPLYSFSRRRLNVVEPPVIPQREFSLLREENFEDNSGKGGATDADWLRGSLPIEGGAALGRINNIGGLADDLFYAAIRDSRGRFVAVGCSRSSHTLFSNRGGLDAVIAVFDASLNLLSIRSIGGSGDECFNSVIESRAGAYIVAGYSTSDLRSFPGGRRPEGKQDFLIASFSESLSPLRVRNVGGNHEDVLLSLIENSRGEFLTVGHSRSRVDVERDGGRYEIEFRGNRGSVDFATALFDPNLTLLNINISGGSGTDILRGVLQEAGGGYVAAGESHGDMRSLPGGAIGFGGADFAMIRYSAELAPTLFRNSGGTGDDRLFALIQGTSGTYVSAGSSESDLTHLPGGAASNGMSDGAVVRFNQALSVVHALNIGGHAEDVFKTIVASPNSYFAAGMTRSNWNSPNKGGADFLTVSLSEQLAPLKTYSGGSEAGDVVYGAVQIGTEHFLFGATQGDFSIQGGNRSFGGWDFFVSKNSTAARNNTSKRTLSSQSLLSTHKISTVKMEVLATVPEGTSFSLAISHNGTDWQEVSSSSLDGEREISLPEPTNALSWRILLNGTETESPKIRKVKVSGK